MKTGSGMSCRSPLSGNIPIHEESALYKVIKEFSSDVSRFRVGDEVTAEQIGGDVFVADRIDAGFILAPEAKKKPAASKTAGATAAVTTPAATPSE